MYAKILSTIKDFVCLKLPTSTPFDCLCWEIASIIGRIVVSYMTTDKREEQNRLTPIVAKSSTLLDCQSETKNAALIIDSDKLSNPVATCHGMSVYFEIRRLRMKSSPDVAVAIIKTFMGQFEKDKTSVSLIESHECISRFLWVIDGQSMRQVSPFR